MITLVIFITIGFIFGLFVLGPINEWEDATDALMSTLMGALFGAVGFVVSAIISLLISSISPIQGEYQLTKTEQLESISDNNSIHGRFFIGSGMIDGKMSYSFYYKSGSNEYRLGNVDANEATVKYSDDAPVVETYVYIKTPTKLQKLLIFTSCTCEDNQYVFHVPKGSIMNSFKLDAQ